MARRPKPYKRQGWYCTSAGGIQHTKLCRLEEGLKTAEIALARLLVKQDDEPKPLKRGAVPTVLQAFDDFMDFKATECPQGTYEVYQNHLKGFVEMFAHRLLKEMAVEDGIKYKQSMIDAEYANTTINQRLMCANTFFNWCSMPSRQRIYLLMQNPWKEIKYLPSQGRERLVTDEEFNLIISTLNDRNVIGFARETSEMFHLLRYSTMRPGELRHLKWEYIDYAENRIVWPAEVVKIRRRREVTLLDDARDILKTRAARLAEIPGNDVTQGYVFQKPGRPKSGVRKRNADLQTGQILTSNALSGRWSVAITKCIKAKTIEKHKNGQPLVLYSFRHTRITNLFLEGHVLPVIMADAGHVVAQTTMRYTHLAQSQVAESIRKADKKKKGDKKG